MANTDNTQAKNDTRQNKLNVKFYAGAALIATGAIIVLLMDAVALKEEFGNVDVPTIVATIGDMISILSDVLSILSYTKQALSVVAYGLMATLHFMLGVANGALSAYNSVKAGWKWVVGIVTESLQLVKIPIEGIPGEIFDLAAEFIGKGVIAAGRGAGQSLMGLGDAIVADAIYQESMNVDDWCAQYDKGACPAP